MSNAKHLVLYALTACSGLLLAGCEPKVDVAPAQPTLSSIAVAPNAPMIAVGSAQTLTVTGSFSNSSTLDLTASSTFLSSDTAVARVSGTGVVSAVTAGSSTITASALGKTATATVTVPAAALVSIAVAAVPPLLVGGTHALTVTAIYADATTGTLTSGLTYATSDAAVASVSSAGLVSGLKAGTATITVTDTASAKAATVLVTVSAVSYAVLDFNAAGFMNTPFGGAAASVTSTGVPSGGPSNPVVQLIKTAGALCYAGNTLSVGASMSIGVVPFSATATTMTVQMYVPIAGVVIKLKVEDLNFPGDASKSVETDVTPTATGWQTLTFNFASPSAGTAAINLANTYNKISIFADFTCANGNPAPSSDEVFYVGPIRFVGAAAPAAPPLPFAVTLSSIAITPNPVNLAPAATQQLTVTATYSNATTANTTAGATFSSDATGVATVSSPGGLVTAVANGTATITATDTASGKTATVLVTVATAGIVNGLVFTNGALDTGVGFVPYSGSTNTPPPTVDASTSTQVNGSASLQLTVTNVMDAYSGGSLVASAARNLSSFNAITFWAKASKALVAAAHLKFQGGDDAGSGGPALKFESIDWPLTTTFQKYVIPVPDPSKFTAAAGLFGFADGNNDYTFWLNDVQYETVPANVLGAPTDLFLNLSNTSVPIGTPLALDSAKNLIIWAGTVPTLPNANKINNVAWRWFTLTSSDPTVATISVDGVVTGLKTGTTQITGRLAGVSAGATAPSVVTITVTSALAAPTTIATPPSVAPVNVISLFSSTYTNVPVDTWSTGWSSSNNTLVDPYTITIGGVAHNIKQYSLSNFVGVEFGRNGINQPVDATAMTMFHVDVWSPNPSSNLEIQLVNDAGGTAAVGKYQAGTIAGGAWVPLEISLANFTGLTARNKVNQLLFVAAAPTVLYIDNVYFHN